jgi:hypothetical protein
VPEWFAILLMIGGLSIFAASLALAVAHLRYRRTVRTLFMWDASEPGASASGRDDLPSRSNQDEISDLAGSILEEARAIAPRDNFLSVPHPIRISSVHTVPQEHAGYSLILVTVRGNDDEARDFQRSLLPRVVRLMAASSEESMPVLEVVGVGHAVG